MKLYKYMIIAAVFAIGNSSCSGFLDEEIYESITPDNFYKNEADAKAGLTSVYQTLQESNGYRRYSLR